MQQLPQELITKALALTGINREKMYEETNYGGRFSIENFCFYLLSPEFIEKFAKSTNGDYFFDGQEERVARIFGLQIHNYQKGNSQQLIDLLSKI